jgi:hypothetical protein
MEKQLVTHGDDSDTICASQSCSCFGLLHSALAYHPASHCHHVEKIIHGEVAGTMAEVS